MVTAPTVKPVGFPAHRIVKLEKKYHQNPNKGLDSARILMYIHIIGKYYSLFLERIGTCFAGINGNIGILDHRFNIVDVTSINSIT